MSRIRRVRVNKLYTYQPVGLDLWSYGTGRTTHPTRGEVVRVVNKYGCPPANTMGHCYVESLTGEFYGLVLTNSLQPEVSHA